MSRRHLLLLLALSASLVACHLIVGVEIREVRPDDPESPPADAGGTNADGSLLLADVDIPDAASDGDATDGGCDPTKAFAAPTLVPGVNTVAGEFGAALTQDELELFISRRDAQDRQVLHRATRPSVDSPFSIPEPVVELADAGLVPVWGVTISADALELFFSAGPPPRRLYRATRATPTSPFTQPELVTFPGWSSLGEESPSIGPENQLFFSATFGGHFDLYGARRDDAGGFKTPLPFGSLNTLGDEQWPLGLGTNLSFLYASGGPGASVIRESRRASPLEPFTPGTVLAFPNANAISYPVAASADGCRLYVVMENAQGGIGGADLWVASRMR